MPEDRSKDKQLTLSEHLNELRGRLIKAIISLLVATCILYNFVKSILPHIIKPAGKLVFIAPQEAFVSNIKIAFFGGILLSSPLIIYQIWRFVSDGLQPNEKKYILIFAPFSLILFLIGASFGYFIITPIGIKFLLAFATDHLVPMITISKYISFVGMLTLAFGTIFQLPLVSLFLTKIGIVTPALLKEKRKHAIVVMFIAAATLTPPDVITQCLMAVPLLILYEIGIIFSKFAYKRS